jgi:hypothetical protein
MAAARARGGSTPTAQPRFDAYAGMLVLSLVAMLAGIGLLFADYAQYPEGKPPMPSFKPNVGPPAPTAGAGGAAPGGPGVPAPGGPGVPAPGGGGPGVPAPGGGGPGAPNKPAPG